MPNPQKHPWHDRLYAGGANRDDNSEILGAGENTGYIEARNMRSDGMDGDGNSSKKIDGETILHANKDNGCNSTNPNAPLTGSYKSMATLEINDRKIEVWADKLGANDSLIRIDGVIVLKSPDFPFTASNPIQLDTNESCIGGEFYLTDNVNQPTIYNAEDLLENNGQNGGTCTKKYFDDYNHNQFLLTVLQPPDHPVFVNLVDLNPGGGLSVGYYQYSYRYSTATGDKSQWSAPTPLIPVVEEFSAASSSYPNVKTFSDIPAVSATKFGIKIRLRITNLSNFEFIEIRRTRYTSGTAIGTLPITEILDIPAATANISTDEISVREFTDGDSITIKSILSEEEETQTLAAVKTAKAIRYFNSRLYLMNVTFESRDLENKFTFLERNGEKMFPTIEKLNKPGHNDPYNLTYFKHYTDGEKIGFAILGYDFSGERTFAEKVTGFDNFQRPNRREAISTNTLDTSYLGTVKAATVTGVVAQTHEVFDLANAIAKGDRCTFKNILNDGSKSLGKINVPECTDVSDGSGSAIGYQPYHPTKTSDSDVTGHDYQVNTEVHTGASFIDYNPKGFAPNYFAGGMALTGLSGLPDYVQAFSVVRTKEAKRVSTQGLGFYSLVSAEGGFGANTKKEPDKIWFFSPDIEAGLFNIGDVIANPDNFQVQFVSPLGFFTELYDGDRSGAIAPDVGIDMISYCRILKERGDINVGQATSEVGIDDGGGDVGFVAYGKWRNPAKPSASQQWTGAANGNQVFNIETVSIVPNTGRGTFYEIKILNDDIFNFTFTSGGQDFNENAMKEWHEPVYIVNIIQTGKNVPDQDVNEYQDTGHYQKLNAIIGKSDGSDDQTFQLVDERWEDCIVDLEDPASPGTALGTTFSSLSRFAFIVDVVGIEHRWLDVTYKSAGALNTILTDLANTGTHTTGDGFTIEGVYTHINTTNRFFSIKFSILDATFSSLFFIPPENSLIRVKYDNRIPIRFFGGDSTVGEAIFSPLDNEFDKSSGPEGGDGGVNDFRVNVGFPYRRFEINPRVYIINRTTGVNKIADDNTINLDREKANPARIRQLAAMFTVESRINMPFAFNDDTPLESADSFFPLKAYVMRPHRWDDSNFGGGDLPTIYGTDNNIFDSNYGDDYGAEYLSWGFGGFRFLPQTNIDYSHNPNFRIHNSKAKVGFKEELEFCTRIVSSLKRPINVQDAPGVRTFPALNFFDISDDSGEIKLAFDANTGKGGNLYAITDTGVCLLLTDKRTLHEISGNELATVGDTGSEGILDQLWLTKSIGMKDETWRGAAEWDNLLYWPNKNSLYKLEENQIIDILREGKYHSRVYQDFLKGLQAGFLDDMTGTYDTLHNEYWVQLTKSPINIVITTPSFTIGISSNLKAGDSVDLTPNIGIPGVFQIWFDTTFDLIVRNNNPGPESMDLRNSDGSAIITLTPGQIAVLTFSGSSYTGVLGTTSDLIKSETFVWSEIKKAFMGSFDYAFDQYLSFDNKTFGMRNMETYELNKGTKINNAAINGEITQVSAPVQGRGKEFIRIRVNSDNKPTGVDFYNDEKQFKADDVQALLDTVLNVDHLLDYDGFVGYIPRKTASPNDRMQGRQILYKIKHNKEEPFKVISSAVQHKPLS